MHLRLTAAAGAITIAAAVTIPASPALADSFRNDQWYLKSLHVSEAQAISRGSGVVVAVIDTGTYPHPDLRRNLLPGINFTPGSSGDGRGDQDGHGTNMAALVAAHGNGPDGVLGISPSSKILPIKIGNKESNMSVDAMAKGVKWAADHGAKVINISAETGPAFELVDSVGSAIEGDIVVVSGVGNVSKQAIIGYPAAIDGVLVVGAVDEKGRHASLSVNDSKVQICAPGVNVTTAEPKNRYADVDGTSASTAIVSGAVALVRAKFPGLSGPDVINRLTATADDIGPPGRDNECGFGLLNIVKALTADVPPLSGPTASPTSPAASGATPPSAAPASSSPVAESAPSSSSTPLVLGVLVVVVAAGALVAALVLRRRRRGV